MAGIISVPILFRPQLPFFICLSVHLGLSTAVSLLAALCDHFYEAELGLGIDRGIRPEILARAAAYRRWPIVAI